MEEDMKTKLGGTRIRQLILIKIERQWEHNDKGWCQDLIMEMFGQIRSFKISKKNYCNLPFKREMCATFFRIGENQIVWF